MVSNRYNLHAVAVELCASDKVDRAEVQPVGLGGAWNGGGDVVNYHDFLEAKRQLGGEHGFEPLWMPTFLFDFQQHLVDWALRKGRAAIFADCGLGKTPMQLVWAQNVFQKTNKPVLILTPLAVSHQTVAEAHKFGMEAARSPDGSHSGAGIVVTNYERLHHFQSDDFAGVVCDESSILKNFDGATRQAVTDFMRKRPYRLLCTATAAPNDYIELGTSSEALGVMERKHMLAQFFTHDGGDTSSWILKGHARSHLFWRWVCSWAMAIRKPSDLGYDDNGFKLPPLTVRQHTVKSTKPIEGYLFDIPAVGLEEQRNDLRATIKERCELAAELVNSHDRPAVVWCNLNVEGNTLAKLIRGGVEVAGSDSDERKEEVFSAFCAGQIRVLITKPTIAGFGLNMQHCAHETFFPSHSYEQFYQATRRCWRFGQTSEVVVDMITTDGQNNVLRNLEWKTEQASKMFGLLVQLMCQELKVDNQHRHNLKQEEIPAWL